MELYEKGKNNSLLSDTVQDVKDEIIEAFYSEEGDLEENIDVIEVKGTIHILRKHLYSTKLNWIT